MKAFGALCVACYTFVTANPKVTSAAVAAGTGAYLYAKYFA